MNRLRIELRHTADRCSLLRWHLSDGSSVAGHAGGADSGLPAALRLRDGYGWKAIVLAALRIKLGGEPGMCLIGEGAGSAELARRLALQLYQGGNTPWLRRLFGADQDDAPRERMLAVVTCRIRRLVDFDNPNGAASGRAVRIFAASGAERCGSSHIDLLVNGVPAEAETIRDCETALAKELGIAPLAAAAGDTAIFGREKELSLLDELVGSGAGVVQITGPGGRGKTGFVRNWLCSRRDSVPPVFEFSLYRQAHDGFRHQALFPFAAALEAFLGLPEDPGLPALARVRRWIERLDERPALLFLDGFEVLLNPAKRESAPVSYPEIMALIDACRSRKSTTLLVTTRVALRFGSWSPREIELAPLADPAIASILAGDGVPVSGALQHDAIGFTEGSPLFAHLLAALAKRMSPGDASRGLHLALESCRSKPRALLHDLFGDVARGAGHRMLQRHEIAITGTRAEALLRVCCVFQGDPDPAALMAVLESHRLTGSPDLGVIREETGGWEQAADELRRSGLASGQGLALRLHPVVQGYFADSLRARDERLWRALHIALYDYYRHSVLEFRPRDRAGMIALLHAAIHGCLAGEPDRVHHEIMFDRFSHGYMLYPLFALGAAHEVTAAMEAIRSVLQEPGSFRPGLESSCSLDVVESHGQVALCEFERGEELLDHACDTGYASALRLNDPHLASILVFVLVNRILLARLKGDHATARRTIRRLAWLTLRKKSLLQAHVAEINRDEARVMNEFVAAVIAAHLLDAGHVAAAGRLFARFLRDRRLEEGSARRILPDLAGRFHGEYLVATGRAGEVRQAIEDKELESSPVPHAFGNAIPYLRGTASLSAAFSAGDPREARRLAEEAKRFLDQACLDGADRIQPQNELPARLARAEWAIAARDETLAMSDLRHVRSHAARFGFRPFFLRAGLLSMVAGEAFGTPCEAPGDLPQQLKASQWKHPAILPFLGRGGKAAAAARKMAGRRFD